MPRLETMPMDHHELSRAELHFAILELDAELSAHDEERSEPPRPDRPFAESNSR